MHLHRKERGEGKRGEGREGMISLLETKGNSELFTVFLKVPSSQLPYQLSDTTVLGNLSGGGRGMEKREGKRNKRRREFVVSSYSKRLFQLLSITFTR